MSPAETLPATHHDSAALRAAHGLDDAVLEDIRAVGGLLAGRVPEMIDEFYRWLTRLPEFGWFFTSEQLLARVKAQQAAYWRDFLSGEVDQTYVERRRVVGEAHARIELGLLIYLQAMEFVSAWLRREAEADGRLLRERPTAVFAVRKLIKFDSSIVVDTYAARTARRLAEQRERLEHVATVMRAVTEGDLTRRIDVSGPDDQLGQSLNEMVQSLANIAREMGLIARGDYSMHVAPRSEKDELGASLQAMTQALREAASRNERHMWLASSQTELAQAMSGNPTVAELSQRVLAYLGGALDAHVGAQYVLEPGGATLRLAATYATVEGSDVPARWPVGAGLVGQAARDKRRRVVNDVPADAIRVRWGLGEAVPRSLVVQPLTHEDHVLGVLELGSLGRFTDAHLDLLDHAGAAVGLALAAAEARARIQALLEEARAQSDELTAQQEELRQVNATLEAQTRALELQKDSLVATETVLRQKASELERASRYKSEFLANMSHELRTPLNSALILAKLLYDNKAGNLTPAQVKYARNIASAGEDLLALINDILDLAKIEAGRVELEVAPVPLATLVANLQHRFEPLAAEKSLAFEVTVDPRCPPAIETDPQRAQQLITNLLSNAVKFTERGAVRLRIAPHEPDKLAFTVHDTGIGIPADQHEVIFEAFRQADGTTNRRFGGTGLGLSIARELAALLGGEIRLRSAPGEGSAFSAILPLRAPVVDAGRSPARPSPAPREPSRPTATASATAAAMAPDRVIDDDRDELTDARRGVLIIEDDPVFAALLRDLAREAGFLCVATGTADGGLWYARTHRPAAIVLDIGLPDQSGLAVLELIKRDPAIRHTPVHVVSIDDYAHVARELGAVGYVLKPAMREQLVAAFHELRARLARRSKTVLVVEDDHAQRDALTRLLAADGVEITAVASAEAGLAKLRDGAFDCVVLDLMMPEVSGFTFLEKMPRDPARPWPPVIVYTARSLSADEEQQLRRLSKSIIVKGARSPERLLEEVTLFVHQVEAELPLEKQRMLQLARDREAVFEGRRVLLVEDDVRNIFALTAALEPKGLVVEVARNGLDALARLERGPRVDVVLMDLMMPEMDGLQATREIRARREWQALPILALTAKAMADDRRQARDAGVNDYIAKPLDLEKLLALLRVWMPR